MVVYGLFVLAIAALFPRGIEGLWDSLVRPRPASGAKTDARH